jgi:molybdate transport system substrate-binding protein
MRRPAAVLLAALSLVGAGAARADTLSVAAASDLDPALGEIVAAFRARNPTVEVKVSYGSSEELFARIAGGSTFELFYSADETLPQRLVESGAAVIESLAPYAKGRALVVTSRGRGNLAATALLRFTLGTEGRAILVRRGFAPPGR